MENCEFPRRPPRAQISNASQARYTRSQGYGTQSMTESWSNASPALRSAGVAFADRTLKGSTRAGAARCLLRRKEACNFLGLGLNEDEAPHAPSLGVCARAIHLAARGTGATLPRFPCNRDNRRCATLLQQVSGIRLNLRRSQCLVFRRFQDHDSFDART